MPVTDDPELSPLAVLAVNSLRETYKQRGPHAFDEAALILFVAVGSIIARTRGREGLHVQWKPSALRWRRAQMGLATPHRLRSTEPARLTSFVTDCCDGELAHLRRQKISGSINLPILGRGTISRGLRCCSTSWCGSDASIEARSSAPADAFSGIGRVSPCLD
jgi:hypothetical protein